MIARLRALAGGLVCKALGDHHADWTTAIMCATPLRCRRCHREL